MMADNEFQFDFHKFLEVEYENISERLRANRHQSLNEVWELQGQIRMLRTIGGKFKDMIKEMHGGNK